MKYRVYIPPEQKRVQMDCFAPVRCGFTTHERIGEEWKCLRCGHVREHPFGAVDEQINSTLQRACESYKEFRKERGMDFWQAVNAACFVWGVKPDDLQYALSQRSAQARTKGPEKPEKPLPYKD